MPPACKVVDSCTLTHRLCYCFRLNCSQQSVCVCVCVSTPSGVSVSVHDCRLHAKKLETSEIKEEDTRDDKIVETSQKESFLFDCVHKIITTNAAAHVNHHNNVNGNLQRTTVAVDTWQESVWQSFIKKAYN